MSAMSRLIALIDDYKDRHGNPSDASIARAIEVSPQTVSAWRRRGIRELPNAETMRKLAAFIKVGEAEVFYAAGVDAGYIIETVVTEEQLVRRIVEERHAASRAEGEVSSTGNSSA